MAKKYCPKCKKFIDGKHFAKNPGKRDGLNSYCRVHQKEYQQDWYRRNKDKHKVLEFDHVRGKKRDSICGFIKRRNSSLDTLKAEIAKCEARCANCHRRRTVKKLKWFRGL